MSTKHFAEHSGVNFEQYFADTLGVTKFETDRAHKVILWVEKKHAPYVLTKPLHTSQQLLADDATGLTVLRNFELEREILGFGDGMKVLGPRNLQNRIKKRIAVMRDLYETKEGE